MSDGELTLEEMAVFLGDAGYVILDREAAEKVAIVVRRYAERFFPVSAFEGERYNSAARDLQAMIDHLSPPSTAAGR